MRIRLLLFESLMGSRSSRFVNISTLEPNYRRTTFFSCLNKAVL